MTAFQLSNRTVSTVANTGLLPSSSIQIRPVILLRSPIPASQRRIQTRQPLWQRMRGQDFSRTGFSNLRITSPFERQLQTVGRQIIQMESLTQPTRFPLLAYPSLREEFEDEAKQKLPLFTESELKEVKRLSDYTFDIINGIEDNTLDFNKAINKSHRRMHKVFELLFKNKKIEDLHVHLCYWSLNGETISYLDGTSYDYTGFDRLDEWIPTKERPHYITYLDNKINEIESKAFYLVTQVDSLYLENAKRLREYIQQLPKSSIGHIQIDPVRFILDQRLFTPTNREMRSFDFQYSLLVPNKLNIYRTSGRKSWMSQPYTKNFTLVKSIEEPLLRVISSRTFSLILYKCLHGETYSLKNAKGFLDHIYFLSNITANLK